MRLASMAVLGLVFCACARTEAPKTEGLGGATIRVSNLEASLGFYRDLLGFPVAFELKDDSGKLLSAFLQVNDDQYLELTPNLPAGEDKRMTEIRFQVRDIGSLRRLPLSTPPILGRDRARAIHFLSPLEQPLGFIEYTPKSMEAQSRAKFPNAKRISQHLLHAGIVVNRKDVDAALLFYGSVLGFKEFWRGGPEGAPTAWINMRTEGDRGDYVELMLSDGHPDRKRLGSMQHICLQVPDIKTAQHLVKERDAKGTQTQKPRVGRNGKWQLNLFDPDGTRVELMEPKEAVLARRE